MRTVVEVPGLRVVAEERATGTWWGIFEKDQDRFGTEYWRRLSELYPNQKPMHLEDVVLRLALALERWENRYRGTIA